MAEDYNQREHMEQVVREGGSVWHRGHIINQLGSLPSEATLAKGDREKEAAARSALQAHRAAIDAQLAELDSGEGLSSHVPEGLQAEDLSAFTVAELKERAKGAGVEGYSTMKKEELIEALQ